MGISIKNESTGQKLSDRKMAFMNSCGWTHDSLKRSKNDVEYQILWRLCAVEHPFLLKKKSVLHERNMTLKDNKHIV